MAFLFFLAFLPLFLALLRFLPGLFVILLGLFALAVAITIPRVVMDYPGLMAVVIVAAIVTSMASTFLPRVVAWKLFEHGANRKAIRYRRGEDTLFCHVIDPNRRYELEIRDFAYQFVYQFVWFPKKGHVFFDKLRIFLSLVFYITITAAFFLSAEGMWQKFLLDIEGDRKKELYPWSAAASFVLILAGTHWLDRRIYPRENMIDELGPRFQRAVNRTMHLDVINSPENQRLVEQLIKIGFSVSFTGDRLGQVFLDHLADAVGKALQEGRDPATLAAEVNTRLLAAVADLSEAKKAMQKIFALREEVQYVMSQCPDPSEQGFHIAKLLDALDGGECLNDIVFDRNGLDAISAGRVKAGRIVADLEGYLAKRRGEKPKGEGARSDRPSQGGRMSRAEALSILGLQEGASRQEIMAAYRRLIKAVHPDHGGTDGLAIRLNEARDVLLS